MLPTECLPSRRSFIKLGAALAAGISSLSLASEPVAAQDDDKPYIIGPQPGYSPEIGTMVSMLAFTRMQVLHNVKGLSQADLDFLLDAKANTVGALLNHLAATEAYYQMNTFDGIEWDKWPEAAKKIWDVPMNLGEPARKTIKGHSLDYYVNLLNETREKTLAQFRKRDDKWLAGPAKPDFMNNYGKWFHVAEHESNHDGQIKFLKSRVPGAKASAE